jgi:hypothetical protein
MHLQRNTVLDCPNPAQLPAPTPVQFTELQLTSLCVPRAAFSSTANLLVPCLHRVRIPSRKEGLICPPPEAHPPYRRIPYLQTPSIRPSAPSVPCNARDGQAPRPFTTTRPSRLFRVYQYFSTFDPPGAESGCCCNAVLYSSSHRFQPSGTRFNEEAPRSVIVTAPASDSCAESYIHSSCIEGVASRSAARTTPAAEDD